jgi:hypothetical protein
MPSATLTPTFTPTHSSAQILLPALETTPTILDNPDTGWYLLQPGLERRMINIYTDQDQWVESLYMLRLNLNQFRLDVAYHQIPR